MSENVSSVMEIDAIKEYLPHRYPFLLVDRVTSLELNQSIEAIKNVSINEPFFTGHFPQLAVMPGVLIVEAMAQTAGCLVSYSNKSLQGTKVVYLTSIDETKFKKQVIPGTTLFMEVKILNFKRNFFKFSGKTFSNNELMATANFSAMLG